MSTSTTAHVRCPRCDAHVRPGSDWCTLCYSDLRPAPAEEPAGPAPAEEPADPGPVPGTRRSGKHARPAAAGAPSAGGPAGAAGPTGASVPEAEIAAMLAQLAADSAAPLGRFAGQLDSPGRKIALMVGGTVVATIVVVVLMTLVGVLL